jgi:hypothetical protein
MCATYLRIELKKVRAILGHFRCMIGNTAEIWSYCSSDSEMLRVWSSCSPFVPSECVVKMVATLDVCTKVQINIKFHFRLKKFHLSNTFQGTHSFRKTRNSCAHLLSASHTSAADKRHLQMLAADSRGALPGIEPHSSHVFNFNRSTSRIHRLTSLKTEIQVDNLLSERTSSHVQFRSKTRSSETNLMTIYIVYLFIYL